MAFERLKLLYLRAAFRVAQQQPPPPGGFAIGGEDAEHTDVVLIRLWTDKEFPCFTFHRLKPDGAEGFWQLSNMDKGIRCRIKNNVLLKASYLLITHHLEGYEFRYSSIDAFLWAKLTCQSRRYIRQSRKKQRIFNAKTLVRRDRTSVLRIFVEKTLDDAKFKAGPTRLMSELYTDRWVKHPEREKLKNHYTIILKSLDQSGELASTNHGYEITPKAVTTLAEYEEDEQRHKDNHRQQVILGFLTYALVAVAILQAVIAIWSEIHPDPAPQTVAGIELPLGHSANDEYSR